MHTYNAAIRMQLFDWLRKVNFLANLFLEVKKYEEIPIRLICAISLD